jgi:putative FmdB family regulatory protein
MPIYEYECQKCRHIYEIVLSHVLGDDDDDPAGIIGKVKCPKCDSTDKKFMMSRAGLLRIK